MNKAPEPPVVAARRRKRPRRALSIDFVALDPIKPRFWSALPNGRVAAPVTAVAAPGPA